MKCEEISDLWNVEQKLRNSHGQKKSKWVLLTIRWLIEIINNEILFINNESFAACVVINTE